MIESGEVPSYKIFTHEPEKKRKRRHAKENREAAEAEEFANELGLGNKLFLNVIFFPNINQRLFCKYVPTILNNVYHIITIIVLFLLHNYFHLGLLR